MTFGFLSHRRVILCLLFVLGSAGVLPAQDTQPHPKTAEEIAGAIAALESSKFSSREQAARDLWQIGLPAEHALEKAMQNGSPDARARASAVLQDFHFGILPSTSRQHRELIGQFRYGSIHVRNQVFREVLVELPTSVIERLIVTELDPAARTSFLTRMLADRQVVKHYRSPDAIIGLANRTAASMNSDWRRNITATLMFTPQVIAGIAEAGKLSSIDRYVAGLPRTDRKIWLTTFCKNFETARRLILSGHRDFLCTMLRHADNDSQRAEFAIELFKHPVTLQALLPADGLFDTLDDLAKEIDAPTTQLVLQSILRQPDSIDAILTEIGLDGLMQLAKRIDDRPERMDCIGHIMADRNVVKHLQSENKLSEILRIAQVEPDAELQAIYLKTIVTDDVMDALAKSDSPERMRGIWDLIAPLQDAELQQRALTHMVATPSFVSILKDRQSAHEILEIIAGMREGPLRQILVPLVRNQSAVSFFADSMLLGELLIATEGLSQDDRDGMASQIVSTIESAYDDTDAHIRSWLDSAADLQQPRRCTFLASLAILPMPKQLAEQLVMRIIQDTPQEFCAPTLALLSRSQNRTIDVALHSADHCEWVLDAMLDLEGNELQRISSTIAGDASFANAYLDAGQLGELAKQCVRLEYQNGILVFRKLFSHCPEEALAEPEIVEQLIEILTDSPSPESKPGLVSSMLRNATLMQTVIETDQLVVLLNIAFSQTNYERKLMILSGLFIHRNVQRELFRDDYLEIIVSNIDRDWPPAYLDQFTTSLLSSGMLRALRKEGSFQSLIEFLLREGADVGRGALASEMLEDYQNVRSLIESNQLLTVFDVVENSDCMTGRLALQMCGNQAVLVEFDQAGRVLDLMNATMHESVFPIQSNSPVPLFHRDWITRLLAASGRTQEIYRFIREQRDVAKRLTLLKSLVEHQPNTDFLLPKMQFRNLWELIETQSPDDYGLQLKSQLVKAAGNNEIGVSENRLTTLYQAIERTNDRSSQTAAIMTLMSASVPEPNTDLHLENLLHWIDLQNDVDIRSRWVSQLVSNVGPAALITRGRTDLLTTLSAQGTTRISMVNALFRDESSVDALRDANQFERLLRHYESDPDRHNVLFAVLMSRHACKYLDLETQITPWITAYLVQQKPDARTRTRVIKKIGSVDHLLRLIIDAGQLPTLVTWANEIGSEALRLSSHSILLGLWLRPACLDFLLRESRTDELLASLRRQPDPQAQLRILRKLVASEHAIICLAKGGQLKELLKLFEQFGKERYRSMIDEFIFEFRSFSLWAGYSDRETLIPLFKKLRQDQPEYDRLARQVQSNLIKFPNHQSVEILFELLSGCSEPVRNQKYHGFLLNTRYRWKMVGAGRQHDLLHVAKQTQYEQHLKEQILFSTTGVVANQISRKKYVAAEKLLLEHANHEKGYTRLAAFWMQRGVLPKRIEELQTTKPNSPMLPFLLKCDGQFDEAADAAIQLGDVPQAIRVLVQGRRWQRAANLEQQQLESLPTAPNDPMNRAEVLAHLAVFQHHAARHQDCQRTCDELTELANENPLSQVDRLCCNVLLLTDQIEPAIEMAGRLDRTLSLMLLGQRAEYERAFDAVDFTMDDPQGWVNQHIKVNFGERRKLRSTLEILQVCELLDHSGNRPQADAIYERLVELFPIDTKASERGPFSSRATPSSKALDKALDKALLKADRLSLLFPRLIARMRPDAYPAPYTSLIDHSGTPFNEAYGWWGILNPEVYSASELRPSPRGRREASTVPTETRIQRLWTLHDLLSDDGLVTIDGERIQMSDYIDADVKRHGGSQRPLRQKISMLSALIRLDEKEHAVELFGGHADRWSNLRKISSEQLGRALYLTEDFADAVEPLRESWESAPFTLKCRYLAADALLRSGAVEEGQESLQIASLMAVQVNDRAHLIKLLDSMGAQSLGTAEANVLYHAAPTKTLHWFDVCQRRSETEPDQNRIAGFIGSHLLRYQLPDSSLMQRSDAALLHKPHLHRAAAAIDERDFDGAQQHIDTMLSINRVDPQITELLLPRLKAAGRDAQADSLSERLQQTRCVCGRCAECARSASISDSLECSGRD